MKPNSIKYEFLPLGTVLYAVCLCIRHDVYAVGEKMLSFQFVLRCKCMQSLINSIQNVDLLLLECEMPHCTVLYSGKKRSFFKNKPLFWNKDEKAECGVNSTRNHTKNNVDRSLSALETCEIKNGIT